MGDITENVNFETWRHQVQVPKKFSNDPRNMLESFLQMRRHGVNAQDLYDYKKCLKRYSSEPNLTDEWFSNATLEILEAGIPPLNEEVLGDALGLGMLSIEDRSVGVLLGVMIGDCLGAPVEGFSYDMIRKRYPNGVSNLYPATHMGIRSQGIKYGEYTDDTNSTLALAQSIAHYKAINGPEIALSYALFWQRNGKGYPDSAQSTMRQLLAGSDYRQTGTHSFPDGSYANGGAMRISPIGIVGRDLDVDQLRLIVEESIRSTHIHPEAIDGALIIALMIGYCYKKKAACEVDRDEIFRIIFSGIKSEGMKSVLEKLQDRIKTGFPTGDICEEDLLILESFSLLTFQIRSIEAVPLVVYSFLRWHRNPYQCLVNTIQLGGDTDTTGSMVGGILGALHGTSWIPHRLFDPLENGDNGRDYAIGLALALSKRMQSLIS